MKCLLKPLLKLSHLFCGDEGGYCDAEKLGQHFLESLSKSCPKEE